MDLGNGIWAVKFGATWCGPCKVLGKTFSKMEEEFQGVNFLSVDVDDIPQLAKEYRIRSLPTVILLRDGKEQARLVGAVKAEPLRKAFRDLAKAQAA
jgi:thioredoxin 1